MVLEMELICSGLVLLFMDEQFIISDIMYKVIVECMFLGGVVVFGFCIVLCYY